MNGAFIVVPCPKLTVSSPLVDVCLSGDTGFSLLSQSIWKIRKCSRSRFLKALLSKSPGIWFCQFCWNLEPCFNQCLILNVKWDGCWGDFLCWFGLLSWQLLWFVTRTKCGGTRNQAWWRILWRCSIMLLITSSSLPNRRYVDADSFGVYSICVFEGWLKVVYQTRQFLSCICNPYSFMDAEHIFFVG